MALSSLCVVCSIDYVSFLRAQNLCKLSKYALNSQITRRCLSQLMKGFGEKTDDKIYDIVKPGLVSDRLNVPDHINAPNYNRNVNNLFKKRKIDIKAGIELENMRKSCKLARKILNIAIKNVQAGITTDEIDRIVHDAVIEHDAYRFVFQNGYHGDCAETVAVGETDESGSKLIEVARECRDAAIRICGPQVRFSLIGSTISSLARSFGFNIVPVFCGHGIGSYFHGPPDIFHFENNYKGKMEKGMTFTIEPVISEGRKDIIVLKDGWTAVTVDNSRAAQFEHTILITDNGVDILTE